MTSLKKKLSFYILFSFFKLYFLRDLQALRGFFPEAACLSLIALLLNKIKAIFQYRIRGKKTMKAAFFLFIFLLLIPVQPAFAADTSEAGETGKARISELYSDLESFDVTVFSEEPDEGLTLEALLVRLEGKDEEVLAREVFPVDTVPANTRVIKVGSWDAGRMEDGGYALRGRLLKDEEVLSEAEYKFVYGRRSIPKLRVNDLIPNSEGISVVITPNEPVLFDIEYMLVDGSDVVFTARSEKVALTGSPEAFSASWGTLLENNRKYLGRLKILVYSPKREFIASTESFTAKDDAEITDIYEDETGASATVFGRSQVPFEGSLVFTVYKLEADSGSGTAEPVESVREKVPVLLTGDDETVEVAWKQRLPRGVYRLEIELTGNDGDVIERRETIVESDLSSYSYVNGANGADAAEAGAGAEDTEDVGGEGTPGFSSAAGLALLGIVSVLFRKRN